MSKHFEVGTPMPLGHRRHTVNSRDEDEMNQAVELLAEKLAPMVAKLLEGEGKEPATNGSNGRRMPPQDQWDTLPDGDGWGDYNLNDAIDPPKGRKPGPLDEYDFPDELRGDHYDNLPTD